MPEEARNAIKMLAGALVRVARGRDGFHRTEGPDGRGIAHGRHMARRTGVSREAHAGREVPEVGSDIEAALPCRSGQGHELERADLRRLDETGEQTVRALILPLSAGKRAWSSPGRSRPTRRTPLAIRYYQGSDGADAASQVHGRPGRALSAISTNIVFVKETSRSGTSRMECYCRGGALDHPTGGERWPGRFANASNCFPASGTRTDAIANVWATVDGLAGRPASWCDPFTITPLLGKAA